MQIDREVAVYHFVSIGPGGCSRDPILGTQTFRNSSRQRQKWGVSILRESTLYPNQYSGKARLSGRGLEQESVTPLCCLRKRSIEMHIKLDVSQPRLDSSNNWASCKNIYPNLFNLVFPWAKSSCSERAWPTIKYVVTFLMNNFSRLARSGSVV